MMRGIQNGIVMVEERPQNWKFHRLAEGMLKWTRRTVIRFQLSEDELLLALAEPPCLGRPLHHEKERRQSNDNRGDALQHEQPLPVGEASPATH